MADRNISTESLNVAARPGVSFRLTTGVLAYAQWMFLLFSLAVVGIAVSELVRHGLRWPNVLVACAGILIVWDCLQARAALHLRAGRVLFRSEGVEIQLAGVGTISLPRPSTVTVPTQKHVPGLVQLSATPRKPNLVLTWDRDLLVRFGARRSAHLWRTDPEYPVAQGETSFRKLGLNVPRGTLNGALSHWNSRTGS